MICKIVALVTVRFPLGKDLINTKLSLIDRDREREKREREGGRDRYRAI